MNCKSQSLALLPRAVASLACLAPLLGPALAQQKPAASAGTAPAPAVQTSPAAPEASPPKVVRTEILAFDSWTVTCRDFAPGGPTRSCQAALEMVREVQGAPPQSLLTWSLWPEAGKLAATLVVPTGVLIAPGVELRIGKAAARTLAYASCDNRCATAAVPLDEAWLKELATAEQAEAVVQGVNGKSVRFTIPLAGFDKALAALKR